MTHNATKSPIYKLDSWNIIEESFETKHDRSYQGESIFALGNGYIGMRGTFEEGLENAVHPNDAPKQRQSNGKFQDGRFLSVDGTYINGFYESKKIEYPEPAYGYAEYSQTMLNVPNGKNICVLLGDEAESERLHIDTGTLENYTRTLNMETGLLERKLIWRSPKGRKLELVVKRLVSFDHRHIAAIEFCLTPHFTGHVQFESVLDGNVQNVSVRSDPRVGSHLEGCVLTEPEYQASGTSGALVHRTPESKLMLASAMDNDLETTSRANVQSNIDFGDNRIRVFYDLQAVEGEPITLHKYLAYVYAEQDTVTPASLMEEAKAQLNIARKAGFAELEKQQAGYMQRFWGQADISIKGKENNDDVATLQQGIHFNMFHLLQAAGRDGMTNIGSKGLTGEGYEGHYFWDTEMFAAPFFQHVQPDTCRGLLQYRHHILDLARKRARALAHQQGAAFPWRTINGEECSSFFPAGTAQYHINADIAYAIKSYVEASGDTHFLIEHGAEIVFETARLWVSLGHHGAGTDAPFYIDCVTGPDEYTALVNNNCYTNLMAQENLRYACEVADWLETTHSKEYAGITKQMKPPLADDERSAWKRAADKMFIPYDKQTGLFAQDDAFFNRAEWPWDMGKRDGKEVLLSRFHYLVIYRHKICKQADVVLALYLLRDCASLEDKRRNFDYYERITTHDSSLSTCTFSIVANEIGEHKRAYGYFIQTARLDLDDSHGNVTAGVHIANMAGTWMSLVNGFARLRLEPGNHFGESIPHYKPCFPRDWEEYSFKVNHPGCVLKVTIKRGMTDDDPCTAEYELLSAPLGGGLKFKHYETLFTVVQGEPRILQLPSEAC